MAALAPCALGLAMAFGLAAGPAAAGDKFQAESDWSRNDHAAVRIVSAQDSVGPDGQVQLGLEFDLKPGWHIYWRAPGDAGYPPRLDWSASDNLAGTDMSWPLPERYTIFGLHTFTYAGNVILPVDARVSRPDRPLALDGTVSYLVCEEICVPYDTRLSLTVPANGGPPQPTAHAARIKSFAARVPPRIDDPASAPLGVTSAALVRGERGMALEVLARATRPFDNPELLVEGPRSLRFGPPSVERGRDATEALIRVPVAVAGDDGAVPERPRLVLTLADGGRAVEQTVTATRHDAGHAASALWGILGLALLGGLILNLMPCVLPVLSLKLLGVVSHGGGARRDVRRGFLATTAGILVSFWVLAGAAAAFKATGAAVGWGVQFQSPAFLAVLALVVTLFAASLFGLFHIPMPGFAGRVAERPPHAPGSLGGAFVTGAFATLLATPCSAPFLGTALGFALTRGPGEIFAVFSALGLGLALPYIVVAVFPGLATRLPRPGPWMRWLRIVLGVALLGTAVWLLGVLWTVAGTAGAALAAALLALLLVLFALRGRVAVLARARGALVLVLVAALAVAVPVMTARDDAVSGSSSGASAGEAIPWRDFDKVTLHNMVTRGKVVFVDVTADWCITCKANKALVIDREPVAGALAADGVVAMRADWTRPSPAISAYLESFGRYGIPFNAVYGPGAPGGIVLPELLTEHAVMEALARARGAALAGQ